MYSIILHFKFKDKERIIYVMMILKRTIEIILTERQKITETMCRICHRDFTSVEEMNEHLKLCQKSLSCQKCDKICDSIQLFEIHVDICDSDEKFKCYVCGKKYKNEKECYSHTKTCKGKLSYVNCNKKFKN